MIVRQATAADVPEVASLEERLFGLDAWSAASVEEELGGERRLALVAVGEDKALAGYAVTVSAGDLVDLQRIAVAPAYQRRGVAHALLGTALEEASVVGAEQMLAEVSNLNKPALAFYATEGFVEIDRRRGYYRDGSDALVLRRAVGPRPTGCGGQRACAERAGGH